MAMLKIIPFGACLLTLQVAVAQTSLTVMASAKQCSKGDSMLLVAKANVPRVPFNTLHVWIEDLAGTQRWKLRYPVVNGKANASIVFADSFPAGQYAMHCALQREGLYVLGQVKDRKPPTEINMLAMAANKDKMIQSIAIDSEGFFQMQALLFEGKATFVFSPTQKHLTNWLDIALETPLDSSFVALADTTLFFSVEQDFLPNGTKNYQFNVEKEPQSNTLADVEVIGKKKTPIAEFEEKHVHGQFESNNAYYFDGISSDAIGSAASILEYLQGQVPGLDIVYSRGDTGIAVSYRDNQPVFYVDEFETDIQGIQNINPANVALIKVFRPPFFGAFMGGPGGAIAVYTKKGNGISNIYGNQFRFVINGYTPEIFVIK